MAVFWRRLAITVATAAAFTGGVVVLSTSLSFARRRSAPAALITVLLVAAGCTSGGGSSPTSAGAPTVSSTDTSPTSSTRAAPTTGVPASGSTVVPTSSSSSAVAGTTAVPEPVAHGPVGMLPAFKSKPAARWSLKYSQLDPASPKGAQSGTVDVALTGRDLSTYLVFASPPNGQDRLLFGVDAASGKIRWRYPTRITSCSGPISGTSAVCDNEQGTDLISFTSGKRLLHFAPGVRVEHNDDEVVTVTPGPDYPAVGTTTQRPEPDASSAPATHPPTAGPSSVRPGAVPTTAVATSGPTAASSGAAPPGRTADARITSYDATGKRRWSTTGRVSVASYQPTAQPDVTVVIPPGALVTSRLVVLGSLDHWIVLNAADGTPSQVTLPESFGGQLDHAGRVVWMDESGTARYWTPAGQLLLQHAGKPVDIPVFDAVPPLYVFVPKHGDGGDMTAVNAAGKTVWTAASSTVDAYCNGLYLVRPHDGRVVTALDGAGKMKWSATMPGNQYTGQPKITCALGQVISAADGPEIAEGTLAVLNATNGRILFNTKTVAIPFLDSTAGQLLITGLDQSRPNNSESVLVRYR